MEEKGRCYLRAWTARVPEVPFILDVHARERSTRRESRAPEPRGVVGRPHVVWRRRRWELPSSRVGKGRLGQGWAKALVGRAASELGLWGARWAGGARRGGLGWASAACWVGAERRGSEGVLGRAKA